MTIHRFLPVSLFLLRKVILPELYFLAVNQVPRLQEEEDHAAKKFPGGSDTVPFHEGGDTVRTDGVRADTHQTLAAEIFQRAALYPEHAFSDTPKTFGDMVISTAVIRSLISELKSIESSEMR